jgi:5'-nucleotidase
MEGKVPHNGSSRHRPRTRAILLGLLLALPLAFTPPGPATSAWPPGSPPAGRPDFPTRSGLAKGRLLAFNDFHGALDPPGGSSGLLGGVPAGGVEYLATYVKALRANAEAKGETVVTVGAGDMVGASPLLSAAFHDEPTVEALSELGLELTAVGQHEFDEGLAELRRLQRGGCHPTDGCLDGDPFAGARYRYLAANVVDKRTRAPVLGAYEIKLINGVPVGFVGLAPRNTPTLVNATGIQTVDFLDEVQTANAYAKSLSLLGVKALVLLIGEGGQQNAEQDPSGCASFSGPIAGIVAGLRPEYGIVISGRTHRAYSCRLPNASGATSVVTSAGANGTLVTSIGFTLDKQSKRFASISAQNVIVANGVQLPDGSWARDASGNFIRNPDLVDPEAKQSADTYRVALAPLANRVIGRITADITRSSVPSGESPLGDVVADALLAYTTAAGAQLALMNPGGIRADLAFASSSSGEAPGEVTYAEIFAVQPFNNLVVTQTLTGAQLKEVLEQQFVGFGGQTTKRILQISAGFAYTYDSAGSVGEKVSNISLHGVPLDPAATYRVTTSDFLANGGDGFTRLTLGTERVVAPGFDIDALAAYLAVPVSPGPANRISLH